MTESIGKYELNNIYNEDSYLSIKAIPDKSIDLIIIDPPYLYKDGGKPKDDDLGARKYNNKMELKGKTKIDSLKIKNRVELKNFDITKDFDYKFIIPELIRVCKKVNIFIWCSNMQHFNILNEFNKLGKYIITELIWRKTNPLPSISKCYLNDLEYCWHFRESGTTMNDSYDLASKFYESSTNKADKNDFDHPTIKPLPFIKRMIEHCSNENDIIADFFLGSGTTAVASKELNRKYLGFEINKQFYDIAVDRLKGITKFERTNMDAGQLSMFDELINS